MRPYAVLFFVVAACSSGGDDGSGAGQGPPDAPPAPGANGGGPAPTITDPGSPPPACGAAGLKGGDQGQQTLTVAGAKRTYALHLPAAYDGHTVYPLVLAFHGDGGTGAGLAKSIGLEAASGDTAIFAYPDGLGQTWDNDTPGGVAATVAFTEAIVGAIQKTYCADTKRTFLTGFSRGAYAVNQIACRTKIALRGVVANAGGGPFGVQDSDFDAQGNVKCAAPPVAALQIIGDADDLLGDGKTSRDYWRRVDKCGSTSSAFDPTPCTAYASCAQPEVFCEIPALGHAIWSSSPKATWKFFSSL